MTSPAQPGAEPAALQQHAASTIRSTPLAVPVHDGMTAPWALAERVRRSPSAPLVARKPSVGRRWIPMSATAFRAQVREVAAGLMSLGLRPGDAIAIMSHTCFEWTLLDFAAWEAGLVVVPIYETSSAEQAEWILTDASVRLVVVENAGMEQMVEAVRARGADQAALAELRVMCLSRGAITDLIAAGKGVDRAGLDARAAALTSADLATIVYTSGTTGRPKGVELTHGNLIQLGVNTCEHVPEVLAADEVRALMFLPLAHVLGRFIEIAIVCSERGVMGHAPDVKHLVDDLATFSPTFVVAVPRVFEKIYNAADARSTGNKQKVFRLAAKTAIAYSRALDTPEGPSRGLRAQMRVFDRLVFSKLRALLGGRVSHVISGGGPLGERLGHYYRGAGVTVLEGYGLTETSAPCAVTLPASMRIGTVGGPMPGTELRLADDGEILVRGIGLFRGYHANPGATAEALTEDGWLRTGDIGAFEDDGSLRITGRKKELIVTAGGKNVAPAVLEDRLRGHPLVSQVLVVGDNRPCIGALVTLDAEMLPLWLASHGIEDLDPVSAVSDPRVRAALERAVARANEAVSRAESIRTFTVLPGDFTIDNGLLTPSLKVRRAEALERFADEIDALYSRPVV
ncbi:long-chain-fatty-acid--CoA ligase [Actinomyces sp. Chiba101]|uniref:Acyl-CoA synthetase n=1 Tax=Actinomyces denticolens TaxID=52767 RepID=A0ABY1HZ37_9ACTO|nr:MULTISPECIES: long-chain fatty acid--CoA ligase [Actinomyces]BAW93591.1 long-chain-fatty-acid--CoA ligase [Actinomyces sp. Chiba101]GAV93562.1 long-chain-fatty-acid--CoA ligase [Actinomyces denticolens]SHI34089.1 long-chain acyl-CoA synthetase [Actinomyces denticolens]SUU74549.1 Long-chain-fatty-acid--CoA ligase FadD15 [Actinomyces denticolens]